MALYMQIDDITGNVTESGHEEWIQIDSLQWGVGRAISSEIGRAADRESSQPSISEITVTKLMDESSPDLFTEACTGDGKTVTIDFCKTGQSVETYMQYELENCMISGYSVSSGGDRPMETISLSFTKITMTYTPTEETGELGSPIPAGYDMQTASTI